VTMNGTDMQLRFPEGMKSQVDSTLTLRGTMSDALLTGLVNVKDAVYQPAFSTGGGFFDFGGGEENVPAGPSTTTVPLRYDIQILAPSTLQIRNNTLRLVAQANVNLRGTFDKPVILGRLEVVRGEAFIEAKKFRLTRGTIDFNNPSRTEPFFDIEAESQIRVPGENYRVTLRASGPPDRLRNFALTSDPPLPESDVLALVFSDLAPSGELGQYRTDITPQQQLIRQRAALALTGRASEEVNRVAQQTLGVDAFQITPSISDPNNLSSRLEPGARVTIFKRVSDKISLTYSRSLASATRDQIILLEYDQTDQFSWTLSRNEDGTYAIDWQVRRTF